MADNLRVRVIWENDEASLRAAMNEARQMFTQAYGGGGSGASGGIGGTPFPGAPGAAPSAQNPVTAPAAVAARGGLVNPQGQAIGGGPGPVQQPAQQAANPQQANPNNQQGGGQNPAPAGRRGGAGGALGYAGRYAVLKTAFGFMSAIGEATEQQQSLSDMNRRVGESMKTFKDFEKQILSVGEGLGISRSQMIQLTNTYVSSVGRLGSNSAIHENVRTGIESAKGLGISPDLMVGFLGNQGKQMQGAKTDNRSLAATLSLAVESGMSGREEEVVHAIEELTQLLGRRLPSVGAESVMGIASLLGAMSETGVSGLQGQRGAQVAGQLDSYLQGGGTGAQQSLLWRFMGAEAQASGRPISRLGLRYEMEEGLGSEFMVRTMQRQARSTSGQPMEHRRAIFSAMSGLNWHQSEAMLPVLDTMDPSKAKGFAATMKKYPNLSPTAFGPMAQLAAGGNVQDALGRFGDMLSGDDATSFAKAAEGVSSPQAAMDLIAKFGGSTNKLLTEQDKLTESFTGAQRAMEKLATEALPFLAGAANVTSIALNAAAGLLDLFNTNLMMAAGSLGMVALAGFGVKSTLPGGGPGGGPGGSKVAGFAGRALPVVGSALLAGDAVKEMLETAPWVGKLLERAGLGDALGLLGESIFGGGTGSLTDKYKQGSSESGREQSRLKRRKNGPAGRGSTHRGGIFSGQVTTPFGAPAAFGGTHTGIDYAGDFGDPIHAPVGGTVERTWWDKWGGHQAVLKDANGFEQQFAHMQAASKLKKGQVLKAGDLVGEVGSSGSSTGPHLHYETRGPDGKFIDPNKYLAGMPGGGGGGVAGNQVVHHHLEVVVKQPDGSEERTQMNLTSPFRNIVSSPDWGVS